MMVPDDVPSLVRFRSTDRARAPMIPLVNIGSAGKSAALETPLQTLGKWLEEARSAGAPEPEAMALATVGADGRPAVRFVLCRGIDEQRGALLHELREPQGSRARPQPARGRGLSTGPVTRHQVRIEGEVTLLGAGESDAYFHSRARGSQLVGERLAAERAHRGSRRAARAEAPPRRALARRRGPAPGELGRLPRSARTAWSSGRAAKIGSTTACSTSGRAWRGPPVASRLERSDRAADLLRQHLVDELRVARPDPHAHRDSLPHRFTPPPTRIVLQKSPLRRFWT